MRIIKKAERERERINLNGVVEKWSGGFGKEGRSGRGMEKKISEEM